MEEKNKFELVEDDLFLPGSRIKIEHTLFLEDYDITDLLHNSLDDIRQFYTQSSRIEEKSYERLKAELKIWERIAKNTRRFELALKYLEIAPAEHTGNQWVEDEKGGRTISNMVYKMTCSITESTKWNLWSSNALNKRWHVEWQIILNTPKPHHHIVIAGKERNYSEQIDAENYLNGRIHAFAKYFQDLSPSVPKDYEYAFSESGLLLPGYHMEGEEPKQDRDSVLGKLDKAKSQQKVTPAVPSKKKNEPEI